MSTYDGSRDLVGLTALGSDGKRLGKVLDCGEQFFLVERLVLFHFDYLLDYAEIARVADGRVYLRSPASYYRRQRKSQPRVTEGPSALNSASTGYLSAQR